MELEKEDFEWLLNELSKPPKYNEKLAEALKRPLIFDKELREGGE